MFGFGKQVQDCPTVPLPEALEWLGIASLPRVGQKEFIPVGRDQTGRGWFLSIETDRNNQVSMSVSQTGKSAFLQDFNGAIIYNGEGPLLLRLDRLFMADEHRKAPFQGDVKMFFCALRKGMTEGVAPGSSDNYINFKSKIPEGRYVRPAASVVRPT